MDDLLMPIDEAHKRRRDVMRRLWDYYRGRHGRPLRVRPGAPDDNVTINYARRAVNKGVHFLFGAGIQFEVDVSDGRSVEEAYLDEVWGTEEELGAFLAGVGMNGGVTGQVFVRLDVGGELPRLINVDPMAVDVVTADDDVDDVRSIRIVWRSGDSWMRERMDAEEGQWGLTVERWNRGNAWDVVEESVWPYGWPPVFWAQNLPNPNRFWGVSDLEEADLIDAINFVASNINRILRFHAHPKTIGTGFDASVLQSTAVDEFWTVPNPEARVFNLEMDSDLASSMAFLQFLKDAWSKVSGVPELDPERVSAGALSGFALKILYGDLIETTAMKRKMYGGLLARLNGALLELAGFGWQPVRTVWMDALAEDERAETETLAQDVQVGGLSRTTYLERRGYDVVREAERMEREQLVDEMTQETVGGLLMRGFDRGV